MSKPVYESYCVRQGIREEQFTEHLLSRVLHNPARSFYPLLRRVARPHFALDRLFVDCVGRVRSQHQLKLESGLYHREHANHHFARRVLRMRVSIRRLQEIISPLLAADESDKSKPSDT